MASPSERPVGAQASFNPRRLQSFRRPGMHGAARQNARGEDAHNSSNMDQLQVLIPGFKSVDKEDARGQPVKEQRQYEMAKTVRLSGGGRQSAPPQHTSSEEHEVMDGALNDIENSAYGPQHNLGMDNMNDGDIDGHAISTTPLRWCCSPYDLFFKFLTRCTHLLPSHAQKRKPGKRIAVSEDVLGTYHESFLYGKVALSTRVRAGIRGPFLSTILLLLECIAASLLLALYVRTTYTTRNPRWIRNVQFGCSVFFLLDYIIKLYSAPVRVYYALSINGLIDLISTLPIYFILRW